MSFKGADSSVHHRQSPSYVPALGPRNKKLLLFVFALIALLGANSGYLVSITALEQFTGRTYQNYFSLCMFLGHLILGLVSSKMLGFGRRALHVWERITCV